MPRNTIAPGNWKAVDRDVVDEHGEVIAVAIGCSLAEARANARLMAGSKRMLDAIGLLVTAVELEAQQSAVKAAKKLMKEFESRPRRRASKNVRKGKR